MAEPPRKPTSPQPQPAKPAPASAPPAKPGAPPPAAKSTPSSPTVNAASPPGAKPPAAKGPVPSSPATPAAKPPPVTGRKDPTKLAEEGGAAARSESGRLIVGMKPTERPDPKKIIESAGSVFKSLLSSGKSKLAGVVGGAAPTPTPAAPEPPAEEAAAPNAEAAYAADAPAEAPPAPAPAPKPAHAVPSRVVVPTERLVITVAAGTGAKANQVLARKGVRDAKVTGDKLEFDCAQNRVLPVFKALIEAHVELYGLERGPAPKEGGAADPPKTGAPESAPPDAPEAPAEGA